MRRDMKTVRLRKGVLHVETPLGIVNITVGLEDVQGRTVEHVEIIPSRYAGQQDVKRVGNRLVQLKRKFK